VALLAGGGATTEGRSVADGWVGVREAGGRLVGVAEGAAGWGVALAGAAVPVALLVVAGLEGLVGDAPAETMEVEGVGREFLVR